MVYRALHFVICQCTESFSILMNDLEGVARAVLTCKLRFLLTINERESVAHGTIAIGTTCAALVGAAA